MIQPTEGEKSGFKAKDQMGNKCPRGPWREKSGLTFIRKMIPQLAPIEVRRNLVIHLRSKERPHRIRRFQSWRWKKEAQKLDENANPFLYTLPILPKKDYWQIWRMGEKKIYMKKIYNCIALHFNWRKGVIQKISKSQNRKFIVKKYWKSFVNL